MTAAEVEAMAKMAYLAHGAFIVPWEHVPSAEQERWRAVVRAVVERALLGRSSP